MAEPLCRPCKEQQQDVVAHRIVGKTPMCDAHFRSAMGMLPLGAGPGPVKKKTEERPMAKRIDGATRVAIRTDAAEGMNLNNIAKKHGVAWGTARDIVASADTKIPRVERGGKPAARRGRPPKSAFGKGGVELVTLTVTAELCDGIWATLPLEKKVALLNRLAEAN